MVKDGDVALVEQCKHGNREAMGQLVSQYERPVYNAAYRILGSVEDAADTTQAVFLKVFEHLQDYDPQYRFFSWIYRIAINESLNQLKKRRPQESLADSQASSWQSPEQELEGEQLSDIVQGALMELSEDYRTVVVLKHFSGCSYQEISGILQLPEKTVKSRLYTARQVLRKALQEDSGNLAGWY